MQKNIITIKTTLSSSPISSLCLCLASGTGTKKELILLKDISHVLFLFVSNLVKSFEIALFHFKSWYLIRMWRSYRRKLLNPDRKMLTPSRMKTVWVKIWSFELFCPTRKKGSINISEWSFPVLNFCISVGLGLATPRSASSFMFLS